MNDWVKEKLTFEPNQFQKLNDNYWAYRKNIIQIGNLWEADMKIVTTDEKERIETSIDGVTPSISKTRDYLDNNDVIMMEALADIYNQLSEIKEVLNNG